MISLIPEKNKCVCNPWFRKFLIIWKWPKAWVSMFLSSSSLAQPGLSKAWLRLCPLLEEPHGGCGWHFLLCWWLSELLPRLKEATSKDTTTPLINGIRRTLLQPRLSLSSFHQAPFSRVHSSSNWIWVMMGGLSTSQPFVKYRLIPQCSECGETRGSTWR